MKKSHLLLFVLVAIFINTNDAMAQSTLQRLKEKLTLGIKLEGNGSSFLINDNSSIKSEFGAGGALGNFIRFNITDHFAIQEDIMFVYYSSNLERNGVKDKFEYIGSEVPIYFMGQWKNVSGNRFFVGAGPYFGVGFSAKYKDSDINLFKKYNGEKAEIKRLSNGAAANIGYEFSSKLQISATYKYGFNALDREKDNYKMSQQSFSIGLGYNF